MNVHPLRRWRLEHKLTLAQVGAMIGVSRSTLSHYEAGRRIPQRRTMAKIEQVTVKAVRPGDFYLSVEAAE